MNTNTNNNNNNKNKDKDLNLDKDLNNALNLDLDLESVSESGSESGSDYREVNDKMMADWLVSVHEQNEREEAEAEADWIRYLDEEDEMSEKADWRRFVSEATEPELFEIYENCKRYLLFNDREKWSSLDMVLFGELVQEYEDEHPNIVHSPLYLLQIKNFKREEDVEDVEEDVSDWEPYDVDYGTDLEAKEQAQRDAYFTEHGAEEGGAGRWWICATKTV